MSVIHRIRKLFWFAIVLLLIMSSTILLMPLVTNIEKSDSFLILLTGLLFWVSATSGYVLIAVANRERKWFIVHRGDGNLKMGCRSGLFTFFTNIPATVADVVMVCSILALGVIKIMDLYDAYIVYIVFFLLVLSLNMHCMFNGRIYKSTKIRRMRRKRNYE